jgi:hypothetical protein
MPHILTLAGLCLKYLIIGTTPTALLWWKQNFWTKAFVSMVAFCVAAYTFLCAGSHLCNEGLPPLYLLFLFGIMAASLPWVLGRWRLTIPPALVAVILAGVYTADVLADSYHSPTVTGNPKSSSGRFWHTPLTGQYPRDMKKFSRRKIQLGK